MVNSVIFRQRMGRLTVPAICIAVLSYIGYHAFIGERGLFAHKRLEAEAVELKAELAGLVEERELLEKQIVLLRPSTLDPDMLDERVRAVLKFAAEGEITILDPLRD